MRHLRVNDRKMRVNNKMNIFPFAKRAVSLQQEVTKRV